MKRGQIQTHITRTRVLRHIRESVATSRIEISRALSMDRSTMTHVINDLIGDNLIREEEGLSPRNSGRKPVMISLNGDYGMIMGLEIQPGFYRMTLMDMAGAIRERSMGSHDFSLPADMVSAAIDETGGKGYPPLLGIGLALPGTVDPYKGLLIESPALDLCDYPLTDMGGIPLVMDNDANCFARFVLSGEAREAGNMVCLIGESHRYGRTGLSARDDIGIGLVINGQIYYGSHFTAGEPGGSPFYPRALARLDKSEESAYLAALFRYLENSLYLLDPEVLHIGGELVNFDRKDLDLTSLIPPGCSVEYGKEDNFEISTGAAHMFRDRLFSPVLPGEEKTIIDAIRWENLPGYGRRSDS